MKILAALLLLAIPAFAGSTNYTVAISDSGTTVLYSAPVFTNGQPVNVPFWTNVVDGPINFLIVELNTPGSSFYYGYNNTKATAPTTVVPGGTVDNFNLVRPANGITNIVAEEAGSTGFGTGTVYISWQEPGNGNSFPR